MLLKFKVVFTVLVLCASLAVAQEANRKAARKKVEQDKKIETIVGTWKVQTIVSGKTEVARNPTSGHWIEFTSDGRYVNNSTSIDSGSFRLNENHSSLYLESDNNSQANAGNSSKIVEWQITLQPNMLTMQQKSNGNDKKAHVDNMKYVYVRIEKGSNSLNN